MPFETIKTRSSKSRKIVIFPKGLVHGGFLFEKLKKRDCQYLHLFFIFYKHNLFTLYKVISCGTELHGVNFLLSEFVLLRLEA